VTVFAIAGKKFIVYHGNKLSNKNEFTMVTLFDTMVVEVVTCQHVIMKYHKKFYIFFIELFTAFNYSTKKSNKDAESWHVHVFYIS
jgi:hypothetical protein